MPMSLGTVFFGRSAQSRGRSAQPKQSKLKSAADLVISVTAPHPIPEGMENQPCPITGMFASSSIESQAATAALKELLDDPDIAAEARDLAKTSASSTKKHIATAPAKFLPLNVYGASHHPSSETRALVLAAGGLPALRSFTNLFYKLAFANPHLDKFILHHDDPHGERFALWIAEKMGDGTPWTKERRTRKPRTLKIGNSEYEVAYDRSSAHFAAWHSPKREPHKQGQKFSVEDARIWMRLHFWAARESGMFDHAAFMDYYIRFIGHFVSVYSGKSPPFTRESARWSADPKNIQKYLDAGNVMTDVHEQSYETACSMLPPDERLYTGSKHSTPSWPYELARQ